jgi:hypothetical protein
VNQLTFTYSAGWPLVNVTYTSCTPVTADGQVQQDEIPGVPGHVVPRSGVHLVLADAVELCSVNVPTELVRRDAPVPFDRRTPGSTRPAAVETGHEPGEARAQAILDAISSATS